LIDPFVATEAVDGNDRHVFGSEIGYFDQSFQTYDSKSLLLVAEFMIEL
jgi:hypothetical protein